MIGNKFPIPVWLTIGQYPRSLFKKSKVTIKFTLTGFYLLSIAKYISHGYSSSTSLNIEILKLVKIKWNFDTLRECLD